MERVPPNVLGAVNRAHAYLVDVFSGKPETVSGVMIEDTGEARDIFLWVRDEGGTPTPRPPSNTDHIEFHADETTGTIDIEFQLYLDGYESEFTVEATFDVQTGEIVIGDIHEL